MPTYEYRCRECDETLEVIQSFTDDPLTECPACQGPLKKVFSPVGISFKGGGFYKTDSRGGSTPSDTGSPAKDGATSDSSTEKKDSTGSSSDTKTSTSESSGSSSKASDSAGSSSKKQAKTSSPSNS